MHRPLLLLVVGWGASGPELVPVETMRGGYAQGPAAYGVQGPAAYASGPGMPMGYPQYQGGMGYGAPFAGMPNGGGFPSYAPRPAVMSEEGSYGCSGGSAAGSYAISGNTYGQYQRPAYQPMGYGAPMGGQPQQYSQYAFPQGGQPYCPTGTCPIR